MQESTRLNLEKRIREVVNGVCQANGATAEIRYSHGYACTNNHPGLTLKCKEIAEDLFGKEGVTDIEPFLASEDFSAYRQVIEKASFIFVGVNNPEESYPHHHEKFFMDESAFSRAVAFWIKAANELLN